MKVCPASAKFGAGRFLFLGLHKMRYIGNTPLDTEFFMSKIELDDL